MTTLLRVLAAIAYIATRVFLDLLDIVRYFVAVAALTVALSLVLPLPVASVPALLIVSVWHGYRIARRIDHARERGEDR